jgi:hypothetical protein
MNMSEKSRSVELNVGDRLIVECAGHNGRLPCVRVIEVVNDPDGPYVRF